MYSIIQSTHLQQQKGAILLSILGILILVLILGNSLIDTVLLNHKTNTAFKAQLQAEAQAEFALNSTTAEILNSSQQPESIMTIDAIDNTSSQMAQGKVWQKSMNDYKRITNKNIITGDDLGWNQQPEQWWASYANTYSLSAAHTKTAYSIVEEYGEDVSGIDLGQKSTHYTGATKMQYRVTARGTGGELGTSRVQAIIAKIYL